MSTDDRADRFAQALLELERELNWDLLGELYCHEGGGVFFTAEQIEAQREAGMLFASDLDAALSGLQDHGADVSGRSLYVGAAVAELAPALCEHIVLGRSVGLLNLACPEADELNRAFEAVEGKLGQSLLRVRTGSASALSEELGGGFGHVWMTSVLTDPEAYPALYDFLYRRTGADATGTGDFAEETRAAAQLVDDLVGLITPPALFTTTDEELPFLRRSCQRLGLQLRVPDKARLSAVVGDAVRMCTVLRA